jgi:signal transduction histidine kinase
MQSVSHELRTPLAIALGYAQMLADGELGELSPEQEEPVKIIARRTQMLADMVSDVTSLLDDERRVPERKPVDFGALVRTQLRSFDKAAHDANLDLLVRIEPDLPLVLGNPTRLKRVVDNLLDNAFKFTAPAARSETSQVTGRTQVKVGVKSEGDGLALVVADTGIGIGSDHLDRIFERFYQVDGSSTRRFGGSGLGLALVREIVEAHEGRVDVESTVGEGSTFTVWLPQYSTDQDS